MTASKKVKFDAVWNNHPSNLTPADNEPCKEADGKQVHGNQCAIRLGIALKAAGVKVTGCAKCWTKGHGDMQHVLRAEELGKWMKGQTGYFGKAEVYKGKNHDDAKGVTGATFKGRKGLAFLKDFWTREGEKYPSGDHIDVWNGDHMAHGTSDGESDYFRRSVTVYFWPLD